MLMRSYSSGLCASEVGTEGRHDHFRNCIPGIFLFNPALLKQMTDNSVTRSHEGSWTLVLSIVQTFNSTFSVSLILINCLIKKIKKISVRDHELISLCAVLIF